MDEEPGEAAVGVLVAALSGTASAGLQAAAEKLRARIHSQLVDVDSSEIYENWEVAPRSTRKQGDLAAAIGFLARDDPDFGANLKELIDEARALSIVQEGRLAEGDQADSSVEDGEDSSFVSGLVYGDTYVDDYASNSHSATNSKAVIIGGGIVVACLLGLAMFLGVRQFTDSGEITEDSTCQEFLEAPAEEAQRGLGRIGAELGVNTGVPLAPNAISYDCGREPTARLGDVVLRYRGQF
ncbi:hypothetical protein [Micromonospora sp. NPDC049203]|uniref:hypothetical protein n=1 Tax=Micromonospora sp. NPDC049203 TaxID=3364267 RepID=UPI00371B87C5